MADTIIYLVRHGEVNNPGQIFYGRLPRFGLSTRGWEQAKALRGYFDSQHLTAVYSSPLLRTRQTARAILGETNLLPIHTSRLLLEVDTPFEHYPITAMEERSWDVYSGTDQRYEQPVDILARVQRFARRARVAHTGGRILAVTHAALIYFMALWVGGKPLQPNASKSLVELDLPTDYPPPASVTRLIYRSQDLDAIPELVFNEDHGDVAGKG